MRSASNDLAQLIQRFFEDYLPALRGMSTHTIRSYRDAIVLWLRFAARDAGRRIEALSLAELTAERIERFLKSLERERHNGVGTRNTRLAALHTLARFLVQQRPDALAQFHPGHPLQARPATGADRVFREPGTRRSL